MLIPKDTTVTCPACDGDFEIVKDLYEGDVVWCENCDERLVMEDGDLEVEDEDIYEEEEDDEDDTQRPIGQKAS